MAPDDIKAVATASLPHLRSLLSEWFPNGKAIGKEFAVGNLQGAAGKSLSINLTTGQWRDAATAEKGGDLVSLLAAKEGISQSKAAESLASRIGLAVSNRQTSVAVADYTPLPHAPADAPPPPAHRVYGSPTASWCYRNQSGATVGYVCRFDTPTGKQYAPIAWCRNGTGESWQFKAFGRPRPLYRLELLADAKDEVILIVEGEKTADAAQRLFPDLIVMSWPGGAQAVNYADWTPLKGKRVVIWPDNDQPGKDAAAKISALVEGSKVVKLPDGLSDGWDLADPIPESLDVKAVLASVEQRSKAVKTPEQLLAKVTDETHYRLGSGMLGKGHINCVIGVGGVGKSRWTFNLAHAHAAGRSNFFGWELRGQGGKWCIVGNENDDDRIKTDLQGLSGVFSKEERARAYPLIRWINPDDDDESDGGCIDNKNGRAWLIARLIEERPEFVVFDTLQSVCEALDLNADADMSEACRLIKLICRKVSATCTAIVVHHARAGTQNLKDALNPYTAGNYGRNSKVLYNKSRADVLLFPGDSEDAAKLVVAQGKLNNGKRFTPFGIKFNGHCYEMDDEFDLDAYKNDLDGKQSGTKFSLRQLLECLQTTKLSRSDLIAKAKMIVDVESTTVKNRLDGAKKLGLVETLVFGVYSLTDKGREYLSK